MSEQIVKFLKDAIRTRENDLSNWNVELHKRMEAASEAEAFVAMLQDQIKLLKSQLKESEQ